MHHNKTHKKYGKGKKSGMKKGGFGGSCAMKKGGQGTADHGLKVFGAADAQVANAQFGNAIKLNPVVGGKYSKKNNKKINKSKKNKK